MKPLPTVNLSEGQISEMIAISSTLIESFWLIATMVVHLIAAFGDLHWVSDCQIDGSIYLENSSTLVGAELSNN